MHPSFLPSKCLFFMIISLILILAPRYVVADDGNFSSCSELIDCGNVQDIGYPFWGLNRPESCGHPDFKLNCNGNNPEITIMSVTYRVLNISSSTQVLELARTDYYDNICPTYLINSTFSSSLFEYNMSTQDIRLYYGCQSLTGLVNLTSVQGISNQFECSINKTDFIGYYVTRNITETSFGTLATVISSSLGSCNYSVSIPVLNSEIQTLELNRNPDTLQEALRVGFEVQWSANDFLCDKCLKSDGQCGHNLILGGFICYCSNGSYPEVCPTSPSTPGTSSFL
ncbi:hypothetical protein PTKIN_Ptkin12aG0050500 [Pterospermum kingtungense]